MNPLDPFGLLAAWQEYATDAAQRLALTADVLRERGNQWRAHAEETVPHVLQFAFEPVVDGRSLARPVNYGLVRIPAPAGTPTDPAKRAFVIVDPRAGHGPGIGGFKADSEIGAALAQGHPTYFIGFLPDPVPGQTLDDVFRAIVAFMRAVKSRHAGAEGAPTVIGNCQAGWMVMIAASLSPEDFGPIMLAGAPLSYWAGQRGRNPMRYSGGLLGGAWPAALAGDLGGGLFDGAHLVANFENLDPANTYWKKPYGLYSRIDTEAERYLGFERWWGGHVRLTASEMQWIVENLFVGNRLTAGQAALADGTAIDLRRVAGPVVVLCSEGDNITPPAQALGWITDLYRDEAELVAAGRTIVYSVHASVGHLGIFVSGSVARKEHAEFASAIALIDLLPPGLYEMVLVPKAEAANAELVEGDYVARFERRDFAALARHADHVEQDETLFATAARVSEINLGLYRTLVQPWLAPMVLAPLAELGRKLHPATLPYAALHDGSPLAPPVRAAAEAARAQRRPAAPDNPFLVLERQASVAIASGLDAFRDATNALTEQAFLAVYGNPLVQALAGTAGGGGKRALHSAAQAAEAVALRDLVRTRLAQGGLRAALFRALFYVNGGDGADERGFAVLRRMRASQPDQTITLSEFKALVRDQAAILRLDPEAGMAAIPAMLPADREERARALRLVHTLLAARGPLDEAAAARLAEVDALFGGPFAANDSDARLAG